MKRYLTRIVTFMAYPQLLGTPKTLLYAGNHTYTQSEKERYFAIRKVFYDDGMMPIYSVPDFEEIRYKSLQELKEDNPTKPKALFDAPVLDRDNNLKVWKPTKD
jgi:hypothetical protein